MAGHVVRRAPGQGRPWVLLHGFTGQPASFDPLVARLPAGTPAAAIALPGHAAWPHPRPHASFEAAVDALASVLDELWDGPVPVLGYSLGARLGYGLAVRHRARVARLVAVGGHPGLETPDARATRRDWDAAWSARLREEGLEGFLEAWRALPLFASQGALPAHVQARQARLRRGHDPRRLADALDQLSLAKMPCWREGLRRFARPLDLVVGGRDEKFCGLLAPLARSLPGARLWRLPSAGHNVLLEAPDRLARIMGALEG